jgi:imidazolonepropionase-like amidohydrolase
VAIGQDDLGTIAHGAHGDLIVVDGEPDRRLSLLTQPPLVVMKAGVVVRENPDHGSA